MDGTPTPENATETETPDCRRRPYPKTETDDRGTLQDRSATATPSRTSSAETVTPVPIVDADTTFQFGEPYRNAALETVVEEPTTDTGFYYDGESYCSPSAGRYELPDGDALVFAPVTFRNTHAEESRYLFAPWFTLLADGVQIPETNFVDHPDFDDAVRPGDMERVDTGIRRWVTHPFPFRPGDRYRETAVFVVPEEVEPEPNHIAFRPNPNGTNLYDDETVVWSE